MFRTANGQTAAPEGIRSIECNTEYGITRRLTGAVTSVQKISMAVTRLAGTGHQMQLTRTGVHCEWTKRQQDPNALEEWILPNQVVGER